MGYGPKRVQNWSKFYVFLFFCLIGGCFFKGYSDSKARVAAEESELAERLATQKQDSLKKVRIDSIAVADVLAAKAVKEAKMVLVDFTKLSKIQIIPDNLGGPLTGQMEIIGSLTRPMENQFSAQVKSSFVSKNLSTATNIAIYLKYDKGKQEFQILVTPTKKVKKKQSNISGFVSITTFKNVPHKDGKLEGIDAKGNKMVLHFY